MTITPSFLRGTAIGAMLSVAMLIAVPTFAQDADEQARGPRFNPEHRAAVMEALENRDFDAWKSLVEEHRRGARMLSVITEDNFDSFARIHDLKKQGNFEEARELAEELGLPRKHGKHRHGRHKFGKRGHRFFQSLSEDDRQTLRDGMRACRDDNEDWAARRECRTNLIEQYKDQ